MRLLPDSEVTLQEFNHCHSPADGQFCSAPGSLRGGGGVPNTSAHPLMRNDGGLWGYSHSNSSDMAGEAAKSMGIPGYDWQAVNPKTQRVVQKWLAAIAADTVGSEEPLHHGFQNKAEVDFTPGDTLRLPLTATGGDLSDVVGYGLRMDRKDQEGTPTVFVFPVGTPMLAYSKWSRADAREFGHVYSEAVIAGEFRIKSVRREVMNNPQHDTRPGETWHPTTEVMVVELIPVGVFDPATGWRPR